MANDGILQCYGDSGLRIYLLPHASLKVYRISWGEEICESGANNTPTEV
jgi:hypothetical protein